MSSNASAYAMSYYGAAHHQQGAGAASSSSASPPTSPLYPVEFRLLHDLHAVFIDLQARVATSAAPQSIPSSLVQKTHILLEQSEKYRDCIKRASSCLSTVVEQTEEVQFEVMARDREFATISALWNMAEVAFLHPATTPGAFGPSGSGAAFNAATAHAGSAERIGEAPSGNIPSLVLALLQCLRDNFMSTADEMMYLKVLMPLRSGASILGRLETEVWDFAAKLVVEGQPRDAGKLLGEFAAHVKDARVHAFAQLLVSYPALGSSSSAETSDAYVAAWDAWRHAALAARRGAYMSSGVAGKSRSALSGGGVGGLGAVNEAAPPHIRQVWDALLDILTGNPWGTDDPSTTSTTTTTTTTTTSSGRGFKGLRNLPVNSRSVAYVGNNGWSDVDEIDADGQNTAEKTAAPYADWPHLCACTILYGTSPPNSLGRGVLAAALGDCMRADGYQLLDVDDALENAQQQGNGNGDGDDGSQHLELVLGALAHTLEGDAVACLRVLHHFKQYAAAAHLADLLWHAGQLDTPVLMGTTVPGSPPRAYFLLQHAESLYKEKDARLARASVSYLAAISPDMVLAETGVPLSLVQATAAARNGAAAHGVASTSSFPLSPAQMLLSIESTALPPALRKAKLAIMTGSALGGGAEKALDKALSAIPVDSDADAASAMALANRVRRPDTAREIGLAWMKKIAATRGTVKSRGACFLWAIRIESVEWIDRISSEMLHDLYEIARAAFFATQATTTATISTNLSFAELDTKWKQIRQQLQAMDQVLAASLHDARALTDLLFLTQHQQRQLLHHDGGNNHAPSSSSLSSSSSWLEAVTKRGAGTICVTNSELLVKFLPENEVKKMSLPALVTADTSAATSTGAAGSSTNAAAGTASSDAIRSRCTSNPLYSRQLHRLLLIRQIVERLAFCVRYAKYAEADEEQEQGFDQNINAAGSNAAAMTTTTASDNTNLPHHHHQQQQQRRQQQQQQATTWSVRPGSELNFALKCLGTDLEQLCATSTNAGIGEPPVADRSDIVFLLRIAVICKVLLAVESDLPDARLAKSPMATSSLQVVSSRLEMIDAIQGLEMPSGTKGDPSIVAGMGILSSGLTRDYELGRPTFAEVREQLAYCLASAKLLE